MISIVVPVMNEEESLEAFYKEITRVVPTLSKEYEFVFIDDGSTDKSLSMLQELAQRDTHVRVFSFRKNHGKAEALTLGFQMAKGETIVTLDADLQDRPDQIKKLLDKMDDSYEMVSGWRKDRHDSPAKVFASRIFNYFAGSFWGLNLHDYNCGLKAYTGDAAKSLKLYGGMHRFIPLIAYQNGFSVAEVPVVHDERKFGKSKYGYGILKIFKNLPDMFTMLFLIRYSKRPLHFFGILGSLFSLIGCITLLYLWVIHTFYKVTVGGRPSLFIGTVCIIAGLQIFFTGFLAELLINLHSGQRVEDYTSHLRFNSDKK
ncbi:MAG TPA: glycosyltransferase family 2 protein [Candidatus Saccharimonadales bacterium]|nr:glycosyltransferase family 2 protein [Candidatus Saccharimonadales bacterium]